MSDVIVIGGGIAGVSAAAALSEFGRVTLLERETALGYHASGRSAAMFEETYGKPSTIALNRASREYHMTADGGVLSPRGLLLLGRDADDAAFTQDCAMMQLEEIGIAAACDMVPVLNPAVLTRAAHHDAAWDIDTDLLIGNFARRLRRNGGAIHAGAQVTRINRVRTGWEVTTPSQGTLGAALLVNAAGAWADEIASMAALPPIGLTPLRRSMARIPAPGGHDVGSWPMMFGPGETWYAKPDAGALLVSPADEDPAEPHDAWADDLVLAEGLARYEAVVTTPVDRLLTSWAGLRSFAPDRELVLGPDPKDPAFIWCAGQGGYGFQTAPAASQLVADLAAGRQPQIDAATVARLRPDRLDR